jgi:hypothetical protein
MKGILKMPSIYAWQQIAKSASSTDIVLYTIKTGNTFAPGFFGARDLPDYRLRAIIILACFTVLLFDTFRK